jgi:hypothetical protein
MNQNSDLQKSILLHLYSIIANNEEPSALLQTNTEYEENRRAFNKYIEQKRTLKKPLFW